MSAKAFGSAIANKIVFVPIAALLESIFLSNLRGELRRVLSSSQPRNSSGSNLLRKQGQRAPGEWARTKGEGRRRKGERASPGEKGQAGRKLQTSNFR